MSAAITRATFDEVMFPNYAPAAFIPVRGRGARLWDQAGREFVDFAGGIAVNSLGHCHPALVEALTEQAQQLWHVSNVMTNEPALRLASKLVAATFAEKVFFCNSGAEANEAALKLARKYAHDHFGPHKHHIVSTLNSFHGRTLFTVSTGGQPKYVEGFAPAPSGIEHIPYNDIAALEAAVNDKTCAIIVEPVQGEGGVLPAQREFLAAAREIADRHQALLIFDEVQTGMGRSGSLFAYMEYGVTPDILSSAKSLGGGFPIGAILSTAKVAASFGVGSHGTTYGGNPLACAVAERVLDVINTPSTLAGVKAKHQRLVAGLEALNARYQVFAEVRGLGLLLGAVMNERYQNQAKALMQAAEEELLIVLVAGMNVLRFAPSLVIDDADIDEGLARLDRALARFVAQQG